MDRQTKRKAERAGDLTNLTFAFCFQLVVTGQPMNSASLDRQLAAQTCEKGVENGIRQVGSPNRLKLFGFPTPSAP